MKKKILFTLITSLIVSNATYAYFDFEDTSDFTGEAFFSTATSGTQNVESKTEKENRHTTPPLKDLRLKLQEKAKYRDLVNSELAPTAKDLYESETADINTEISKYASQENEETIGEDLVLDEENNENDKKEKKSKKNKKKKNLKNTEEIILDCENVDYSADNYTIYAKGNVNIRFVKQKATVKADLITFDRINNTVKAEGNVRIIKSGHTITGEYIFLDLNEENALIEAPKTNTANIEIKSQKGYVYSDKIVQENGTITANKSFPINFRAGRKMQRGQRMLVPKSKSLSEDMEKGLIKIKVKDLKITQKGEHEILAVKRVRFMKGDKTIFRLPSVKLYTNKNHDYVENASWEIGSYRGLGAYIGPAAVFELPKGSVLRVMPILNYKSELGYGGMARFNSGTNYTVGAYGTATDKIIIRGKQELDDNLSIHYSTNAYMNDWFLGRRRPKYGLSLVYDKGYSTNNFLIKGQSASFRHMISGGYFHDLDFDTHFEKIKGSHIGTTRFRYMAEGRQYLFKYEDKEKLKAFGFDVRGQVSTALYGTGDTQAIARLAPNIHLQYKRWMQDIGYYFSAYEDNTPLRAYDSYRYGKEALLIREYFRVSRLLTLCWFGNINMSNDSPNGKTFQENAFYLSIGPEDFKFGIGYDFIRQNLRCIFEVMMDAKGAQLEYDKFEIRQDKKAEKAPAKQKNSSFEYAPSQPQVLKRAVVENIKVMEDVL